MSALYTTLLGSVDLAGSHLQLLNTLGLLHQDRELTYPQWYNKVPQLMFEATLKLPAAPFFSHHLRVESQEVLKPLHISLH